MRGKNSVRAEWGQNVKRGQNFERGNRGQNFMRGTMVWINPKLGAPVIHDCVLYMSACCVLYPYNYGRLEGIARRAETEKTFLYHKCMFTGVKLLIDTTWPRFNRLLSQFCLGALISYTFLRDIFKILLLFIIKSCFTKKKKKNTRHINNFTACLYTLHLLFYYYTNKL